MPQEKRLGSAGTAELITSGCTTGWADWVWGELWLLPHGLLRLSLGWKRTWELAGLASLSGGGPTVAWPSPKTEIDADEIPGLIVKARRNRWIPRNQISTARLRRGVLNDRLGVVLADGSRTKLLWPKTDPAFDVLRSALGEWLGNRLRLQ